MAEKYATALWLKTGRQNTQTSANPSSTIALMLIIYLCAARNTWPDLRSPTLAKRRGGAWNYQREHFQSDCRCRFRIKLQAQYISRRLIFYDRILPDSSGCVVVSTTGHWTMNLL